MSRLQTPIWFGLLVVAVVNVHPRLTNAQDDLRTDDQVRAYFAEQQEAYASAKTLKDAVTIAKQRLTEQGLVEYAGIIDEARIKAAILSSIDWWESQHSQAKENAKRPDVAPNVKHIVSKQGEHFRDVAKPQYEKIAKDGQWPKGAHFFVQGGNTPGRLGLKIDVIIDARNKDGSGFTLGQDLPEMTTHALEIVKLNYGRLTIPENAKNEFKALSSRD